MEILENTYCRFCAESKASDKVLKLVKNDEKYKEIIYKLNFVNAIYVDLSNSNDILPKTVCLVCYDSLKKACDFFEKVKRSQEILLNLFTSDYCIKHDLSDDDGAKHDLSDDDKMCFDDHTSPGSASPLIKEETSIEGDSEPNLSGIDNNTLTLKEEPKDESNDISNVLENAASVVNENPSSVEYGKTLNVQDILDATICNMPYAPNLTIYAKEVMDTSKRKIPQWKNYQWICAHCNIEFLDIATLRSHSKITHGKCNAFMCIDCKTFAKSDFESFIKHVRRHRRRLR